MYNFIFVVIYKLGEIRKVYDSKDYAANIVTLAIFLHLFLIFAAILYFTNYNVLASLTPYKTYQTYGKYTFLPAVILIMIIVSKFYKKYGDNIIKNREEKVQVTIANVVLVIGIIVIPLLVGIFFLNSD